MKKLFETASSSEKNNEQVDKIAEAARALRWSEQIVEAKRVQSITEMQIKTMDHMMDAWEEQLKLPNPTAASPSTSRRPAATTTSSWCRRTA